MSDYDDLYDGAQAQYEAYLAYHEAETEALVAQEREIAYAVWAEQNAAGDDRYYDWPQEEDWSNIDDEDWYPEYFNWDDDEDWEDDDES